MTDGHVKCAIVQLRRRGDLQVIVEWTADKVGALSIPSDSMTTTCAPDADNPVAKTRPAAEPALTTMESDCPFSCGTLIIWNSQDLKSVLSDNRLEGPTTAAHPRLERQ